MRITRRSTSRSRARCKRRCRGCSRSARCRYPDSHSGHKGLEAMLEGLMQHDYPLTLQHLLGRMRRMFGEATVVTATEGGRERASYTEVADRIDRLCRGLESLGVKQGDRVATFAWNTQRHLEVYLGVPCMGAVLHTLNIRLFADQLAYVVNNAEDSV